MEDIFANLVVDMSGEKILKTELLTRGHKKKKLWYNYGKEVITASRSHSAFTKMKMILKPTGGYVDMWSLSQNISGLSFTNPYLPSLT